MAYLTMKDEAVLIQRLCQTLNLPGEVLPPPVSFETSRIRVYYLDGLGDFDPKDIIKKLKGRLEEALTRSWNRGAIDVRIATRPLRIEVPRPKNEIHFLPLWPVMKSIGNKGNGRPIILLGETYDFDRIPDDGEARVSSPVAIDMSNSATPHVLLAAATGGGKSRLLKGIILSMAAASGPKSVRFVIFDPKRIDFRGLSLPHMACPVIHDPQEALVALRAIVQEMERRAKIASSFPSDSSDEELDRALGPYIVVFIDELTTLVDQAGPEAEKLIKYLLQMARALKINLFLATQRPAGDTIKRIGEMRSNLTVRIIGAVAESEHAKFITGLSGSTVQATTLTVGDFILVVNGRMRRFHALGLDTDEVPPIISSLWNVWSKVGPGWMLDMKGSTATAKAAPADVAPMVPAGVERLSLSEKENRHEAAIAAIKARAEKQGDFPSTHSVKKWWKGKYGKELNGTTAAALLERAKGSSQVSETMKY